MSVSTYPDADTEYLAHRCRRAEMADREVVWLIVPHQLPDRTFFQVRPGLYGRVTTVDPDNAPYFTLGNSTVLGVATRELRKWLNKKGVE